MLDIYETYCMSLSSKQRIGYLAASQSFHEDLDILMLTTNMIRKVKTILQCRVLIFASLFIVGLPLIIHVVFDIQLTNSNFCCCCSSGPMQHDHV